MCLLQPWHYCSMEETARSQTAGRRTTASGCFDSGEDERALWVSIKGVTALNNSLEFDLPPFLESKTFFFLHCIHLNVSWFHQVDCQSDVNRCPLTALLLVLLCLTQTHLSVCAYSLSFIFCIWLVLSPPNFRHSQQGEALLPVSSLLVALASRCSLEIIDWQTGCIMADMTRQVMGGTLMPAMTAPHGWQRSQTFFTHYDTCTNINFFKYRSCMSYTYGPHIHRAFFS